MSTAVRRRSLNRGFALHVCTIVMSAALTGLSFATGLHAADWETTGTLTQSFSAEDNRTLNPDSPGVSYTSTTTPSLSITGSTRRTTFGLDGQVDYTTRTGPAEDEINGDQVFFNQGVATTLNRQWQHGSVGGFAKFSQREAQASELEDTGIVDVDTQRRQFDVGANLTLLPTRLDAFGFSAKYTNADFTDDVPALSPFESYSGAISWNRVLTKRLTGGISISGTKFEADAADDEASEDVSTIFSLTAQINPRLVISAGAGVSYTQTEGDANPTGPGGEFDNESVGFIGNLDISYDWEASSLSAGISQTVQPSSFGTLVRRNQADMAYAHKINTRTSFLINLTGQLADRTSDTPGQEDQLRRYVSVSPGLKYQIYDNFSVTGTYKFSYQKIEDDDSATSNGVFLKFTYQHPL